MSDFELVSLFSELVINLQTSFMNYVAVLFAFLVGGYMTADKLDTITASIFIGLFSLVTLQQASPVLGFGNDASSLAALIAVRAADDPSGLGWHGAASSLGSIGTPILGVGAITIILLSYLGALVFFFHQRRVGLAK